jgi:voltage-gated potassium channel
MTQQSAAHRQLMLYLRRLAVVGFLVLDLLLLGAVALALSEGVDFWYAFQWALDTAATVGGFPHPRSTFGQIVEVLLVLVGVGTLFYALAIVADLFVAGHLSDLLAARRKQKMIDSLTGHHIICGFGRVGRQVARDLAAAGAACVVIETYSDHRATAEALGFAFIEGDATEDDVLMQAGVMRARSIVACADSDANNVFITLSARELRDDVTIVARAAAEETEKKLRRAGADRVISPYKSSGAEMARLALHRQVSGVIDVDADFRIEEIEVNEEHAHAGHTIGGLGEGLLFVGLRRAGGFEARPAADTALMANDVIVALGTPPALERLEDRLEGRGA